MKVKYLKYFFVFSLLILINAIIFNKISVKSTDFKLSYIISSDQNDVFQLFYSDKNQWSEEQSQKNEYTSVLEKKKMVYSIPRNTIKIRVDLGEVPKKISISDIKLSYFGKNVFFDLNNVIDDEISQISKVKVSTTKAELNITGTDAFFIINLNKEMQSHLLSGEKNINLILKFGLSFILDVVVFVLLRKSKSVLTLVRDLRENRKLIMNLSVNDFKTKYAGSYLGIIWAFIQPIVTIFVYWFVFEFGLKSTSPVSGVPFVLWFSVGLIPWFFFSESLVNATNCMIEYSYLVKKIVFKISILPIVKIISAFFVHLVFIIFIIGLYFIYGGHFTIYMLQLPYYIFCTFFLVLSFSYITSSIIVFFKDLSQIISIILQIGMWMTPIMWSYTIIPLNYQWIPKLNLLFYIVEGYRDTFINHVWFWDRYFQTIYFWVAAILIFIIGSMIFKKLKAHFADVL